MLDVLKFIFSSFWIWLGTVIMLAVVAGGLGGMVRGSCRCRWGRGTGGVERGEGAGKSFPSRRVN
ncbi:hypothetical protein K0B96_15375 [Horticoccus luteus]|uniref:Uncharacterized protein n=1 Tax=Horticoccus luteus TaxID=2862869 RepID=A0A8F9TV33_9BACT|nr:hypothetical protein [Horticoccus luteus]QYM78665.1 hypothetical protein K0B96_15375 [Horticoccus luteus]